MITEEGRRDFEKRALCSILRYNPRIHFAGLRQCRNATARTIGTPADIEAGYLPNIIKKCYQHTLSAEAQSFVSQSVLHRRLFFILTAMLHLQEN
jgi:hypothetical protein